MTQKPNFKVDEIELSSWTDKRPIVKFKTRCECGQEFQISDHHKFCHNCGKELPRFAPDTQNSNAVYLDRLINISDLKEALIDYLTDIMNMV